MKQAVVTLALLAGAILLTVACAKERISDIMIIDLSCGDDCENLALTVSRSDGSTQSYAVRGDIVTPLPGLSFVSFCGDRIIGVRGDQLVSHDLDSGSETALLTYPDRLFYPRCADGSLYFSASAPTAPDAENKFSARRLLRLDRDGRVEDLLPGVTAYQIGRPTVAGSHLIVDLILPKVGGVAPPTDAASENHGFRLALSDLPLRIGSDAALDRLRLLPSLASVEQLSTDRTGRWACFYSVDGTPGWRLADLQSNAPALALPADAGRAVASSVGGRAIIAQPSSSASAMRVSVVEAGKTDLAEIRLLTLPD